MAPTPWEAVLPKSWFYSRTTLSRGTWDKGQDNCQLQTQFQVLVSQVYVVRQMPILSAAKISTWMNSKQNKQLWSMRSRGTESAQWKRGRIFVDLRAAICPVLTVRSCSRCFAAQAQPVLPGALQGWGPGILPTLERSPLQL